MHTKPDKHYHASIRFKPLEDINISFQSLMQISSYVVIKYQRFILTGILLTLPAKVKILFLLISFHLTHCIL